MKTKFLNEAEMFFLALADATRLRLLNLMRDREVNVNVFVEVLGVGQPKVSRHLAFLYKAGIVQLRRDGKRIHYKIAHQEDEFLASILRNTLEWLGSQEQTSGENIEFLKRFAETKENERFKRPVAPLAFAKSNMKERERQELEIFLL